MRDSAIHYVIVFFWGGANPSLDPTPVNNFDILDLSVAGFEPSGVDHSWLEID